MLFKVLYSITDANGLKGKNKQAKLRLSRLSGLPRVQLWSFDGVVEAIFLSTIPMFPSSVHHHLVYRLGRLTD